MQFSQADSVSDPPDAEQEAEFVPVQPRKQRRRPWHENVIKMKEATIKELQKSNNDLVRSMGILEGENKYLQLQLDQLKAERDLMRDERNLLQQDKAALQRERDRLQNQTDNQQATIRVLTNLIDQRN